MRGFVVAVGVKRGPFRGKVAATATAPALAGQREDSMGLARTLIGMVMVAMLLLSPVRAQTAPMEDEAAWQGVISAQIEAFRTGDATSAFGYAASGFKRSIPDADTFYALILGTGYAPIAQSSNHSFGQFEMVDDQRVMQIVRLVGAEDGRFDALYQLVREVDGWRVLGVQLQRSTAIDI
jgi:hypothetical protein